MGQLGARVVAKNELRSQLIQNYLSLREDWSKRVRKFDKRRDKPSSTSVCNHAFTNSGAGG